MEYADRSTLRFEAGDTIFERGETAKNWIFVTRGTVEARSTYGSYRVHPGEVIGLLDAMGGSYLFDYVATESFQGTVFLLDDKEQLSSFYAKETKYASMALKSCLLQVNYICSFYKKLIDDCTNLYQKLQSSYRKYVSYCKKYIMKQNIIKALEDLKPDYEKAVISNEWLLYYKELGAVPVEIKQAFFGECPVTGKRMTEEMSSFARNASYVCDLLFRIFMKEVRCLSDRGEENLVAGYYALASEILSVKGECQPVIAEMDMLLTEVDNLDVLCREDLGVEVDFDRERLNDMKMALKLDKSGEEIMEKEDVLLHYSAVEADAAVSQLENLLSRILGYVGCFGGEKEQFTESMTVFKIAQKKNFFGDDSREAARNFEQSFYNLYERVFFKAEDAGNKDPAVNLFLNCGLMDEKEFSKADLAKLYHSYHEIETSKSRMSVFTMRQWLSLIYHGEREPSRNDMGLDYRDSLMELKKKKSMTAEEEYNYLNDAHQKVRYEIRNMFRCNNRYVFGAGAAFCPFIYSGEFAKDIRKQLIRKDDIAEAIKRIMDTDYSLFYREMVYSDPGGKVDAMRIQKQILPDIILIPNLGMRGSMWQEIEGKRRVSPARFILPMFLVGDLYEVLLPIVGRYRWELCRTIQGLRWNDITDKSLTSEYYDYIDCYRKNKELSDVVKMKIKEKMSNCHQNAAEMFVQDYISWVKYESSGASRLNKVSREIMAKYCMFPKEIRETLVSNPMFGDPIGSQTQVMLKKAKEIQSHYTLLTKQGARITVDMEENLKYYLR